jgi:prepilin peptidase CpaA
MLLTIIDQITILAFAGLLLWAALSDVRQLIIPNRVILGIGGLWLAHAALLLSAGAPGSSIAWSMGLGLGAFALGFLLFAMRLLGGGDVKLFAVVMPWAGPQLAVPFVITALFAGGILAFAFLVVRTFRTVTGATLPGTAPPSFTIALMVALKSQLPFGLAIAGGGLMVAYRLMLGLPHGGFPVH